MLIIQSSRAKVGLKNRYLAAVKFYLTDRSIETKNCFG
jgi:hypothetical protein